MLKINLKDSKGVDIRVGDIIVCTDRKGDFWEWLVTPIGFYIEDIGAYGIGVFAPEGDTYAIDDSILEGVVMGNVYTSLEEDISSFKHLLKYYR